jgi:Tol biopolymer transport system component
MTKAAAVALLLVGHALSGLAGENPRRILGDTPNAHLGAPSRDGRVLSLIDSSTGDLAILETASARIRALTRNANPNEFAYFSFPAPDASRVAYAWFNSEGFYELRVASSESGETRVLYRNEEYAFVQPCGWTPDGKEILTLFFRRDNTSQITMVGAESGTMRVLKSLEWVYPNRMDLSPDGRWIVYDNFGDAGSGQRDLFLLASDGSRELRLTRTPFNELFPLWTPDGEGIVYLSDRLGTADFYHQSIRDGATTSDAQLVRRDPGRVLPLGIARGGTLFYALRTGEVDVYYADFDAASGRTGPAKRAGGKRNGANRAPAWSPDGSLLAYLTRVGTENFGQESRAVSIFAPATGEHRMLPPVLAFLDSVRWSPEGERLLVSGSDRHGNSGLFILAAGSGRATPLVRARAGGYQGIQGDWWAGGRAVVYADPHAAALRVVDIETRKERTLYEDSQARLIRLPRASPAAEWIAMAVRGGGKDGLTETIRALPGEGGAARVLATLREGGVASIDWLPDGGSLLIATPGKAGAILWKVSMKGGSPQRLSDLDANGGVSLDRSGRRIAFTRGQTGTEIWALDLKLR